MTATQPVTEKTPVRDESCLASAGPPSARLGQMHLRPATVSDCGALRAMHRASLRQFGRPHYTAAQIEGFLADVETADPSILADGTFRLIEDGPRIVASGGWTLRPPSYGGRAPEAPPAAENVATIRGVFVHPAYSRRGLASAIMAACESAAVRLGGATEIRLYATLSGVPLYVRLGYESGPLLELPLSNGTVFAAVRMTKRAQGRGQVG